MNETNRVKEEDTDVGLTNATVPGVRARPVMQAAAASRFDVSGASCARAAAARLWTSCQRRSFRSKKRKISAPAGDAIQVSFVGEPRRVVEKADSLVAVAMKRLAEMFWTERENLEGQWDRDDNVSTEDLRLALRRYRSFFGAFSRCNYLRVTGTPQTLMPHYHGKHSVQ